MYVLTDKRYPLNNILLVILGTNLRQKLKTHFIFWNNKTFCYVSIYPYSEITNVPLCCNRPPSTSKSLRTKFSSMRTKFYDWNASIKHVKIYCRRSCFNKIGPCMIKMKINFTDIALKKRRKNVYIPLSSDNGRSCLHPKEHSRSRLSIENARSLIDTIGGALFTLSGRNFELLSLIRTRDNKLMLLSGYLWSVRTYICYLSTYDYKRRQLMF